MWREVGSMAVPRQEHSCGLVPVGSGYEVVVVGGNEDASNSVEIFSIDTETFQPGNDVPFSIAYAYDIRVNDTFVMVGGKSSSPSVYYDKLFKYLPESGTFMELPSRMKLPRYSTTAIVVDRS